MGEFFAFLAGLVTDYVGQAGGRRAWWMLGAVVVVLIVVFALVAARH
jgi:Na+/melibiose symporter-like transporter